jgi:hypothetical protein
VDDDPMFLSGILGLVLWLRSNRWLKGYKFPYRLLVRILIQLSIVVTISILSTTVCFTPRSYGDVSMFLPLSYPLTLYWGISMLHIFPPYYFYSVSIFEFNIAGGGLEFGTEAFFREQLFLRNFPFFLLMNAAFVGAVLLASELCKFLRVRNLRR